MQSRLGAVRAAAVLAVVAAAGAAGCSSGGTQKASSPPAMKMTAAQELAATLKNSQNVSSFTATMNVQASGVPGAAQPGAGNTALTGTFSYQKQPAELAELDVSSLRSAGVNLGSMSTITTSSAIYLKMPMISSMMHSGKPWLKLPVSELKSGGALSALIGQAQSSNPLSDAQLLAGATNTRAVGTGTVNGVPVTELEGSEPVTTALAKLPASLRSKLGQNIEQLGIGQIKFQAWVDGQHDFRKLIVNEVGSTLKETVEFTVTSLNQPVKVTLPSVGQVATIPASALSGAGM